MDPINSIGKKLTGIEERDCVHIALMPAIAAEEVYPGEEVALAYGTKNTIKPASSSYGIKTIGIVDPFIGLPNSGEDHTWRSRIIEKGEKCYVFLFPGTVNGMRHQWHHPEIDKALTPVSPAEEWLRKFADRWNFDYDEMISSAIQEPDEDGFGGYITSRGKDLHSVSDIDYEDLKMFWECIESITGASFSQKHKDALDWSCTC